MFVGLLIAMTAQAQTVTELFRQGHEMMQVGRVSDASSQLFNKGYNVQRASGGVVLGKSAAADVRLATRISGAQQLDTVRMELRINSGVGSLSGELTRLGYQYKESRGGASVYQNGAVKVAVFNPYKYMSYKIGFFFARDKNAPAPVAATSGVKTITVNGVSFKMVRVEGGTFIMGATSEQESEAETDEEPAHQVTLSTFSIGETEVTQELWQAVMGSNPSYFKGSKRPVEKVNWEDCQGFIRRLNSLTGHNFRLPTEAEWEYAARGGKKSNGYKYSGGSSIGDVAWYDGNGGAQTHDVGTKRANELGLYDMSGNVYEWCQDWKGDYSSLPQTNPTGPSSGSLRVIRGGTYHNRASLCRVSDHNADFPSNRGSGVGLRLAE